MNLKIRKANFKDSNFLLTIRNDNSVKKFSLHSKIISKNHHNEWIKEKIKSKNDKIFIIYSDNKKKDRLSYVRFEKENLFYKVSIAIHKKYRNKNLSSDILDLAEQKFNKNCLFLAKVKNQNRASLKLFANSNYILQKRDKNYSILVKNYNKDSKINNYLNIIDKIEKIRKSNNMNWMDVLRIAFSNSPQATSKIFSKITNSDNIINKLSKKLAK